MLLFENYVVERISPRECKIEDRRTGLTQYGIRVKRGTILYDYPERLPHTVKAAIKRKFH